MTFIEIFIPGRRGRVGLDGTSGCPSGRSDVYVMPLVATGCSDPSGGSCWEQPVEDGKGALSE